MDVLGLPGLGWMSSEASLRVGCLGPVLLCAYAYLDLLMGLGVRNRYVR